MRVRDKTRDDEVNECAKELTKKLEEKNSTGKFNLIIIILLFNRGQVFNFFAFLIIKDGGGVSVCIARNEWKMKPTV